jgi:hypothetical protein
MASGTYNRFKYNLMKKLIDLDADTIKVILLDNVHAFDADDNVLTDVDTNEIPDTSGSGYTTGGETIGTTTVTQDDTNDCATFSGADVTWTSATLSAYHAVIYDDTISGDPLIASIDFGGEKSVTSGDFIIEWSANGIIRLT